MKEEKKLKEKIKKISELVDYDFDVLLEEDVKQFIKEILEEIDDLLDYYYKEEIPRYAIKEIINFIKQKSGFEELK